MNTQICVIGGLTAVLSFSTPVFAQQEDEHHSLDEIVVSATPLQRTVERLALPADVIAGDELARQQADSIGETLASQLGVSASYFGPVASRPVIRGQFGERVRVLSNSLDVLDASALSEDHAVSLDSILADRIEIIRGPATLLYGSGAAGGIVNVVDSRIHDKPLDDNFSGAVALGTASATDARTGAVKLDVGNDNVIAHFDWFRRETSNVEIPGFAESDLFRALEEAEEEEGHDEEEEEEGHDEEEEAFGSVDNSSSETDGLAAALTFLGDRGFIGVSYSQYDSDYGVPGGHGHEEEEEEEEEEGHDEEEEEEVTIGLEQERIDINGRLDLGGAIEHVKFRLARNDYGHIEFEGDEVGTVFDTDGTDLRIEAKHRNIGALEGAVGLQYKLIDFTAIGDEAFVPSSETRQLSVFAFEELALNEDWVIQASARVERQDISDISEPSAPDHDDTAWGASIGGIWSANDALTFAANLAFTERNPNATELYASGPHIAVQRVERGSVTQGQGLLDKETSTNLDLTLRGRFGRSEFSVTGFINDVDDYIVLRPTDEFDDEEELQIFDYAQTDVQFVGFEAEFLVDIIETDNGHMHARLFSDFVYGEEDNGAYLPRVPPLRVGAGLHFRGDAIDASVEASRYSKQDKIAVNEIPTDSYTLLQAEASYRFPEQGVLVFLRGTNLGDEDARRHSSPLKDTVPLPGRSVHLGLRWDF